MLCLKRLNCNQGTDPLGQGCADASTSECVLDICPGDENIIDVQLRVSGFELPDFETAAADAEKALETVLEIPDKYLEVFRFVFIPIMQERRRSTRQAMLFDYAVTVGGADITRTISTIEGMHSGNVIIQALRSVNPEFDPVDFSSGSVPMLRPGLCNS